jgi:hypothetical protein
MPHIKPAQTRRVSSELKSADHSLIIVNEIRKNSLDTQAQIEDLMSEVVKLKSQVDAVMEKVKEVSAKQDKV